MKLNHVQIYVPYENIPRRSEDKILEEDIKPEMERLFPHLEYINMKTHDFGGVFFWFGEKGRKG